MISPQQIKIREAKPDDINLIYDSFLKSQKHDSRLGKAIHSDIFFKEFSLVIDRLLSQAQTLVAVLPDNDNAIVGYLIYEPQVLHYVFIKEAWRNLGVAKTLATKAFKEMNFQYTHKTHHMSFIKDNEKYKDLKFNPFKLYLKEA